MEGGKDHRRDRVELPVELVGGLDLVFILGVFGVLLVVHLELFKEVSFFLLSPFSFLLPPSSFLLPPSSFLLPPSSFLLPPSSLLFP
jgi:hypothetical protein